MMLPKMPLHLAKAEPTISRLWAPSQVNDGSWPQVIQSKHDDALRP